MATIPPDEVRRATEMLRERVAREKISLEEAYDREVAEHNNAITFELARQSLEQELEPN